MTYGNIRAQTGWSRGKIYALACRHGARKTEARIRERAEERRRRQLEFLASVMNTTAKADVLDFLDGIPDDSIQLMLTSPPYNLGKRYGGSPTADLLRPVYYHGWMLQVLSECARILREGGVLCLQVGSTRDWQGRLMPLDVLLFEGSRQAGLIFQSRIVWVIPHGLTPRHRLAERYETALVFSKGERPTFNPTAARIPQKQPGKRAFKGPNIGHLSGNPFGAWPTNVWEIPHIGHNNSERKHGDHPAQFPVALAKRAVLLYSMAGDTICDPFSGSGTTHVAAVETGRAFVGADLFYQDLRAKRLAEAVPDFACELPGVTDESVAVWEAEAVRVERAAQPLTPQQDQQMLFECCAASTPEARH